MHHPARLIPFCCLSAALTLGSAHAHQHWIDVDTFSPAVGQTVTVSVCSGHYFPRSSFVLKDGVLRSVELVPPGGETRSLKTAPAEKLRSGSVSLTEKGVHVLRLTLQRPRAPQPNYEAKTLLLTEGAQDDLSRYAVGRGLELVPGKPLSRLARGDALPLVALLDGKRVSASIEVLVEGGGSAFLKTTEKEPASLKISRSGRYLATTGIKGRGCSLVFMVQSADRERP